VRCFEWERAGELRLEPEDLTERAIDVADRPVLAVEHLRAEHRSRAGTVVAAEDVSFTVGRGECVALVGESGSGKTTIARTIAGLHPVAAGSIALDGEPLADHARRRSVEQRRRVQIVFQNPSEALNPRHTVRAAIGRPLAKLRSVHGREADAEVERLLDQVRLPRRLADHYPLELSGGERQRVGIARALAARPELMICDEITSALDVSVQAAVLKLLDELRDELGLSMLFITHDLGVVASIADRVLVLEQGHICEEGAVAAVLRSPEHEYTRRLLESAPSVTALTMT
jgi:peptide/nickel transport system ATP-binding protein